MQWKKHWWSIRCISERCHHNCLHWSPIPYLTNPSHGMDWRTVYTMCPEETKVHTTSRPYLTWCTCCNWTLPTKPAKTKAHKRHSIMPCGHWRPNMCQWCMHTKHSWTRVTLSYAYKSWASKCHKEPIITVSGALLVEFSIECQSSKQVL